MPGAVPESYAEEGSADHRIVFGHYRPAQVWDADHTSGSFARFLGFNHFNRFNPNHPP